MDFDELPIGERLDALLRQFDENQDDNDGDLDYAQFVERRAQEHGRDAASDAEGDDSAPAELGEAFDSDAEHHWFSGAVSDGEPLISPPSSPGAPETQATPPAAARAERKTKKSKKRGTGPANSAKSAKPVKPTATDPQHDTQVADVYAEAGITPSSQPRKRHTTKQTQRELEEAARQDQRLERMLVDDIGCHTAKTVTVESFLADFDPAPRLPSPAREPHQADKRFSELVSSPPRMQGLRSFVAHGNAREDPNAKSDPPGHDDDSDSELEIVPATRKDRMSRPIRELLRLGGSTAADRQLAASRAKLQQMEREQILNRSRSRAEKLKAQGFDVEGLTNALKEQREASAQGAQAWLAQEHKEAEALRAIERSDAGESDSGESSELEFEGPSLRASWQHADESLATSAVASPKPSRAGRKMVLSDSDDDSEADAVPKERAPLEQPIQHRSTADAMSSSKTAPIISKTSTAGEADTDEDEGEKLTEGTQYVAPLSPKSRQALFGSQLGISEPMPSTAEQSNTLPVADSDTVPDRVRDLGPERITSTVRDSLDDPLAESALPGAAEGDMSSDLEIEVGGAVEPESRIEPDLADIQNADLSLSQRMAEVRQRYLRAENEQRRRQIESKQAKVDKRLKRNAFIEDQAEESDDEEGAGGLRSTASDKDDDDDDDDGADVDLAGLVDHNSVKVREAKLREKFLQEERQRDERLLNHFVDGVNGGFRRRQARDSNGVFLADDNDIEFDNNEQIRAYRQMLEQRRQSKLLGSSSRVARLAASERNQAFFQSVTSELISRPDVADRQNTVQDGLQFLQSAAESSKRRSHIATRVVADPDPALAGHSDDEPPAPATGLGKALKMANLKPPRQVRRTSRQATLQDPFSSGLGVTGTTYASRVSAAEAPSGKTVEIMQSLGPAQRPPPRKKPVVPAAPAAPVQKRRRMVSTTAHKSGSALFHRNWA